VPIGTIHVYGVNSVTGGITEVIGSPFNAGLIPWHLVVDPTSRFAYVVNLQSNDITEFSVDASTGALAPLPGSPLPIGAQPITSAVDPTGRFLYVFATAIVNGVNQEFLYEYTIDSVTGVLTAASSSPTAWEFAPGALFDSIVFSPAGNFAYLGQGSGGNQGAPTMECAVDFSTGNFTIVGSIQPAGGQANQLAISPRGNFLFSVNSSLDKADAFAIAAGGAALSEVFGSPYSVPNIPYSLAVHPSGNFLYVVNENQIFQTNLPPSQYNGSISEFTINPGTGALAAIAGSPVPAGINPTSIVLDPSGRFLYATATTYTGGFTSFAQILGFSTDAISGALTPLSWSPWTDAAQFSNGNQLVISAGQSTTMNPTPMISSLSPSSSIAIGTAFTLQVLGSNFVPGSTVYFGGQLRATTFISATQLNASILASDVDNGGTAVVFVFNPLPGGGASTSVEFPVFAPVPAISSISPSSVTAGGMLFGVGVFGSNFVTSSVVLFNGTPLSTNYGGPTVIAAAVPASLIASTGTASISVTSPANGVPGGGTSNTVTLSILPSNNTNPVVSNISPTSATAGGPGFTLMVNGSGFVPGSVISFNLNNIATTFVSTTQLTAFISPSAIAIAGNPYVIVTNPNGFASQTFNFAVNNPQPVGGSASPAGNALTLNVTGTGFTQSSIVMVGGSTRNTTFVSSTLLQATLVPGDLSQGGTLIITVVNPPPGGGTSGAINFTLPGFAVTGPSLSPSITAGKRRRLH
jgi:DNA-binding beta-propeller fold protein YncE